MSPRKQNAHPPLSLSTCTNSSGCQKSAKSIAIDSNWGWSHKLGQATNCYTGNSWDQSLCPDPESCAKNCALDAGSVSDYQDTYGITSDGDTLALKFVTTGPYSRNVGSRTVR